ncbi:MAG: ribonuclease D [Tepidisphaeraceae bacterium]
MASDKPDFRARHRQRAHDEAHADTRPLAALNIPDHVPAPRGNADLITTDAALQEFLEHLRTSGSFAYDSEFIGESSYHPRLCLIQVATVDRIALIDPLADLDLKPFWELLADASVEKLVHAGAQDVEPVARLIGKPAANVFDTQIAAGFVALAYPVSLAKLVLETTGIVLQKGLTFTYWDQRPLSSKQLRYAADDVRYLPAVARELKQRLAVTGHMNWVRAECDALCDPVHYTFTPESAVEKVRGAGSLDPQRLNVLKHLVIWRDAAARQHDLPARAFLRDEILIDLCRNAPKRPDQLQRIRGMPRPVIDHDGEALLALIARGMSESAEGVAVLRGAEPTPAERFAADTLWTAAQVICQSQSIDPAAVTSRQEIGELYRCLNGNGSFEDLRLMKTWRRAALGDVLVQRWRESGQVALQLATGAKS